ncbi:winged helix-turn-helix transcriptional regulator [Corynebacterium mastitidis]|uniref:Winged helix-turn-helix transcriptional regulator n=1 Tax=Corynebacterium mastitidis TaxID=161890 RepID=A0ABU8NXK6_9CORY
MAVRRGSGRAAYTLTAKGCDLAPILLDLQEWGLKHVDGTRVPPSAHHS